MTPTDHIRLRLVAIGLATITAAEALDGAPLDLCEGTLSQILVELETVAGRLDLVLDRLAGAADPVSICKSTRGPGLRPSSEPKSRKPLKTVASPWRG
jgi:hypothetical protein